MKSSLSIHCFQNGKPRGIALVITLLVIVILTVAVTAFMQSMSLERRTSQAYVNILKAEEAARSGFTSAINQLIADKLSYPNNTIAYREISYAAPAGKKEIVPYFLGGTKYNTDFSVANSVANPLLNRTLVSGNPTAATSFDSSNSIEMNTKKNGNDTNGWIGSPVNISGSGGTNIYRNQTALWVKVLLDSSKPEQPNPSVANFNPVVSRYAYWIEDETSKIDLGVDGNADDTSNRFKHSSDGDKVSDLDLGAIPMLNASASPTTLPDTPEGGNVLRDIINFRNANPFYLADRRVLNRMSPTNLAPGVADVVKFYTTNFSYSDELAGNGRRRANLNGLVTNTAANNPRIIGADLDDIGWVITGKHLFRDTFASPLTNTDSGTFLDQANATGASLDAFLPSFGSRFYSGATAATTLYGATVSAQDLYVKKIAANIRDYIDTDRQPTVVNPAGSISPAAEPTSAWDFASGTKPQAIGKEAIPYLSEHAWRGLIVSRSGSNPAVMTIRIDHYLEFYNPSTKDYVAPVGTFLKVYDQPSWTAGSFPDIEAPDTDFKVSLDNITFPAGKAIVVTTNVGAHPAGLLRPGARVEVRAASSINTTPATDPTLFTNRQTNEDISGVKGFQLAARSSSITDYKTQFLIGNNLGLFDFFPAISISLSSNRFNFKTEVGDQTRFVYSSSMRGNQNNSGVAEDQSRSGDVRSLSEQIAFLDYSSSAGNDQTRWFGNIDGGSGMPGTSTFGLPQSTPQTNFINPALWSDRHVSLTDGTTSATTASATAHEVIRDGPMKSIGELGHIYDPNRIGSPNVNTARGGGRTLKVGQIDDLIPTTRFAAPTTPTPTTPTTWYNSAWRLTDLFGVDADTTKTMVPSSLRGKININSILRDDGAVLRAALRKLTFLPSPDGDPTRSNALISDTEITNLINSMKNYMTTKGPLIDRGELSQLPFFAGNTPTDAAGGSRGFNAIDRGREEIFRRVIELVTTRSNSFTVYVIADAVLQQSNGTLKVRSRARKQFTCALEPIYNGVPIDSANPTDKPNAYRVKLLHEDSP